MRIRLYFATCFLLVIALIVAVTPILPLQSEAEKTAQTKVAVCYKSPQVRCFDKTFATLTLVEKQHLMTHSGQKWSKSLPRQEWTFGPDKAGYSIVKDAPYTAATYHRSK
jgi:hypothetical protein